MTIINNMYSPICLFAYKRPDALHNSLKALEKCKHASKSDLIIYIDGPKNNQEKTIVKDVLMMAKKINSESFKSVKIIPSSVNSGLANSIIAGVTEVLNDYNSIIVLEDDLVPSIDFLEYMNQSLNKYENNKCVGSISGFGFKVCDPENDHFSNYFYKRPTTWGWATWRDRWDLAIWDLSSETEISEPDFKLKFNKGGQDLYRMLKGYMQGSIDSWGIRWAYSHYKNEWIASTPKYTKIINNGYGYDGTNCNGSTPPPTNNENYYKNTTLLNNVFESEELSKQANWYNSNLYKIIDKLKRLFTG